jgi:probable LLM family oxidoreductase
VWSVELGIYSFGELTADPEGRPRSSAERLRDLLEEIELADQVGLDVFGVGEHHRPDFTVSAPAVVLGAAAARTRRIRLSSAVNVISSDDPVRVFEQFATLDLLSEGRAEIMAGRGSFIESFPLFGYDLDDYDELFAEKLDLLLALRESERVSWTGRRRPSIDDRGVYPRPLQDPLPVWIAVGGNPESAARAGLLGLPMALAIIGGLPERFAPFAELHRRAAAQAGHDPAPALSINSHGYLGETSQQAADEWYPAFALTMNKIGRERGWPPITREGYDASLTLRGANFAGTPEQVAEKILFQHEIFGHQRFLLQITVGSLPHAKVMRAIELYGTEVAPAVRDEVARREARAASSRAASSEGRLEGTAAG